MDYCIKERIQRAIVAFCCFNIVLFLFVSYHQKINIRGADGQMYYAYVRSAVIDSDLDFKNEFIELTPFPASVANQPTSPKTNHTTNRYPIGYSLSSLPFFILAHSLTWIGLKMHLWNFSLDGYSYFYNLLVPFGQVIYALLGFIFSYRFLSFYFEKERALLAIVTIWLGSNLIFYATIDTMMPHAGGFFCVSALYYVTMRLERSGKWKYFLWGGLLSGLLIVMRFSNIIFLIYPIYVLQKIIKSNTKVRPVIFLGVFLTLGILFLQVLSWKIIFGNYFVYSYGSEGFVWWRPELTKILFSSNHGLLYWSPVIALSLAGLIVSIIKDRQVVAKLFLSSFLILLYINASWHDVGFGHAFGARAFCEASLIFAFGLAYFFKKIVQNFRLAVMIGSVFILWNFYLLILFAFDYLPRQGEFPMSTLFPFLK